MKQILLMIAVVALVGCGKKPAEESVFDQGRPDVTKPSKPPAKTEAQVEAENKAKAEAGDATAQSNLGFMYEKGQGVEQDFKEAVKWYQKAAEQGYAAAQHNLGSMYEKGQGVEQDFKEAVKWFQKAADQGYADAQHNLGLMYGMGQGMEQDYVTAYAWASIAATNGQNIAPRFKSQFLEPKMTPAQIAKARELVKEMIKKNPKLLKKKE
jgi:TPR repeat protein